MPKGRRGGRAGGGSGMIANAVLKTRTESAEKKVQYDAEFTALKTRLQNQYGWSLDESLRQDQDWKAMRDSIYGVESVLKDFPGAQEYLRGSSLNASHLSLSTLGQAELRSGTISLSDAYFRDQRTIDLVMQDNARSGFHPAGSRAQGVATHETGHLLVTALAKKTNTGYDSVASSVVHSALQYPAVKTYMRSQGIRSNATWKQIGTISRYAQDNYHETIAEAVSDWRANGSRANVLSRAIVRELKGRFK